MQFYVYLERDGATTFWNRKTRAWESALSADCAYPTSRGAAQRMRAYEVERRKAYDFGKFAYGFAIFPRA